MGVTIWNFEHYESINWATARMVEAKEGEYIKWTDHKAALAERDRIIAKACKSLHDSSRALLDELDRVRADFQKREQHLLVMYGYLWKYRMPM